MNSNMYKTSLGVHQYSINRSEKYFHDPDSFIPERWLADAPSQYQGDIKAAMQPFSTGPRNCIGKKYASFLTGLIVANR
jgi:cytochrome P450